MTDTETDRQELLAAAIARRDYENIGDIEERFAPGSKGCHEAMHVACIANDLVAERLCEHPAVLLNPEYYELAARAQQALWDLYQAIGRDHLGRHKSEPVRFVGLLDGKAGAYGVVIPDAPGCAAMGKTVEDAIQNAGAALREWLALSGPADARPVDDVLKDSDVVKQLATGSALVFVAAK